MSEEVSRDSILVIDDNADFRELIAMIGQLYGVRVLQAGDCREALRVLLHDGTRIKLILLDYFMPGMDPARCVRVITKKAGPLIRVVLVTAAPDPHLRAKELHLTQWLSKPVTPDVLTQLMTEDGLKRRA